MQLVKFATERKVSITMLVLALGLFGLVSASRLKLELLPELSYPTITIRTELPGAAPQEVESLISRPIEETVNIIKGVRTVSSVSRAGQSDVTLEFYWGTNMDFAGVEIREKLDMISLPREAERPILLRFNPANDPIMRIGLALNDTGASSAADNTAALKRLRLYADEQLAKALETENGVAAVKVSGGLEEEIQVLVNQHRLAQLDIPIATVAARLAAENVNLSGGRLETGSRRLLVRTINEFQSVDDIANAIVAIRNGQPVQVSDIAQVQRGHKEREAIIRIDGQKAVELAIYKEGDANTVTVAENVKAALTELEKELPEGMSLRPVYDQSVFISQAIDEVISNAILGGILAALVLFFFLRNAWITAIISVSIPICVIATFNVMYAGGISLNIMSLGGIALAIGMLVDNSIVVLENISRHRGMGKSALQAAREGTSEVGGAITASTLTTVAVFFPLVFVHGIAGQLFQDQAIVVTTALLFSLFIALTFIPMLAAFGSASQHSANRAQRGDIPRLTPSNRITRGLHHTATGIRWVFSSLVLLAMRLWLLVYRFAALLLRQTLGRAADGFQRGFSYLEDFYHRLLKRALQHRAITLGLAGSVFVISLAAVPLLGMELIPQFSQGEFITNVRLPSGSQLEDTDGVIQGIAQAAAQLPAVAYTYSVAGTGNRMDANPEQAGENTGSLNVVMQPGTNTAIENQTMDQLRAYLAKQPGVAATFSRPSLFTADTPLEIEVTGYDLAALQTVSNQI
ncbi:MAG TPA: efflux RND transporter permease subunit, partial [Gammaproteobacteria bacterium]|nr:efflux RND transporter permease subunit [Gammaproteobacteria bacterium]